MDTTHIKIQEITVQPVALRIFVPPIRWKGDCVGHIGQCDTFFWVLEGECFLAVGSQYTIVRPGQLAFLPKGIRRAYTHASEPFVMYEMAFSACSGGQDLMEILHLREGDYVVDIPQKEEMSRLFESSEHKEMFKDPLYDVTWCANIINIIRLYAQARQNQKGTDSRLFAPVLKYMHNHLASPVKTEELAALIYMQPTYFIRRFKAAYGLPPLAYLGRLRLYKAMELLASTEQSIEQIARAVGMNDTSYFARVFKKNCGVTPSEYRGRFGRGKHPQNQQNLPQI